MSDPQSSRSVTNNITPRVRRSRFGCEECRFHKKKCDEQRPSCGRCFQTNKACRFERDPNVRIRNNRRVHPRRVNDQISHLSQHESALCLEQNQQIVDSSGFNWATLDEVGREKTTSTSDYTNSGVSCPSQIYLPIENWTNNAMVNYSSKESVDQSSLLEALGEMGDTSLWMERHTFTDITDASLPTFRQPTHNETDGVLSSDTTMRLPSSALSSIPTRDLFDDIPIALEDVGAVNDIQFAGTAGFEAAPKSTPPAQESDTPSPYRAFTTFDVRSIMASPNPIQGSKTLQDAMMHILPASPSPVLADPTLQVHEHRCIHHWLTVARRVGVAYDSPNTLVLSAFVTYQSDLAPDVNPGFQAFLAMTGTHLATIRRSVGLNDGAKEDWVVAKKSYAQSLRLLMDLVETPPDKLSAEARVQMAANATAMLYMVATTCGDTRPTALVRDAFLGELKKAKDSDLQGGAPLSKSLQYQISLFLISAYDILAGFSGHTASAEADFHLTYEHLHGMDGLSAIWGFGVDNWRLLRTALNLLRRKDSSAKNSRNMLALIADGVEFEDELESYSDSLYENADGDEAKRIATGGKMLRSALQVLLLREIFEVPANDSRVQAHVKENISRLANIPRGQEVGLILILLITGSSALGADRLPFMLFLQRAMWRGTAGPKSALRILSDVWNDPDGNMSWRSQTVIYGRPIFA